MLVCGGLLFAFKNHSEIANKLLLVLGYIDMTEGFCEEGWAYFSSFLPCLLDDNRFYLAFVLHELVYVKCLD